MNREQKAAVVEEIAANIKESQAVFAVDYRGLSVPRTPRGPRPSRSSSRARPR